MNRSVIILMLFAFAIASENDEPSLRKSRQISFGGGDPEDLPPGFSNGKRKNNKNRGGNRGNGNRRRPGNSGGLPPGFVDNGSISFDGGSGSGGADTLSSLLGDQAGSVIDGVGNRNSISFKAQGNSCTTPRGEQGVCSFINDSPCSSLVQRIRRRGITRSLIRYLRRAIQAPCGFDNSDFTVCCSDGVSSGGGGGSVTTTRRPPATTTRRTTTSHPPAPVTSCGENFSTGTRIVGGVQSRSGSWPWAVILGRPQSGGRFQVVCGGSLIDDETVLSAAHCFPNSAITHVRLGEHDISTTSDGASPIDIRISRTTPHASFSSTSLKNDIAIVKLSQKVNFNNRIKPICLPATGFRGTDLTRFGTAEIIGWGSTAQGQGTTTALREAAVPLTSTSSCNAAYNSVQRITIGDDQVCGGNGDVDTCTGDSGGPLMIRQNGRWFVIGITSFGVGCANEDFPGVYTRVDNFMNWINNNK